MNFKERVLILAEAAKGLSAKKIYKAGKNEKELDFNEDFNTLIKVDKDGEYIYRAGKFWEDFDYVKGLKVLIKKDKDGEYIYRAGMHWKKFEYDKGLKALKALQNKTYYKKAKREWPIGIKQSQKISKQIKTTAKKLPKKELRL